MRKKNKVLPSGCTEPRFCMMLCVVDRELFLMDNELEICPGDIVIIYKMNVVLIFLLFK